MIKMQFLHMVYVVIISFSFKMFVKFILKAFYGRNKP
jgi:hypothetical protein